MSDLDLVNVYVKGHKTSFFRVILEGLRIKPNQNITTKQTILCIDLMIILYVAGEGIAHASGKSVPDTTDTISRLLSLRNSVEKMDPT